MSGGWVFGEKSTSALAAFKEALNNTPKPSPALIWQEVCTFWSETAVPNGAKREIAETGTENDVKIREQEYVKLCAQAPHLIEKSEDRAVEQWILNFDPMDSVIDEIRCRSETGDSLLYCLSRIISVVDLDKLVAAACARSPNEDLFFDKFLAVFLFESIKEKEHCRTLESSLMHAFQHDRTAVIKSIVVPLLKLDVPRSIVHDFALSLQSDDAKFLLSEMLNLSAFSELQQWHVPILTGLYKRAAETPINEVTQAQMVDILKSNANPFTKDKSFGKLLLLVILKERGNIQNVYVLESVCLLHDTAFKKPSLAAIDKLFQALLTTSSYLLRDLN